METASKNDKKWYKTKTGIFIIVIFLPLIIFLLMVYFLFILSKIIWQKNWSIQKRAGAIAALWGFVIIGSVIANNKQTATLGVATKVEQEGDCIGPDGKRISLSSQACEEFNNAWKNPPQNQQAQQTHQAVQPPTNTPIPTPTISSMPTSIIYPTKPYVPPTATPIPYTPPTSTPIPNVPPVQNNIMPANTGSSDGGSGSSTGDKDCGDFATHAEAQAFFISQGGPSSDPNRLDADNDGQACEALP
jgi:hypothetical protein